MDLYNGIIGETMDLLATHAHRSILVDADHGWEMCSSNEVILAKDTSFELGANKLTSVNYSCVTTSKQLIPQDEILLIGPDLNEIKEDTPFIRIALLNINDLEDETAYHVIKDLEYIKYDVIPKGYMIRASSFDNREQVRVSREAVRKGIDFKIIGNIYINKLKENKLVNAVRILFITENSPEFARLIELANKTESLTKTLNHVLNNMDLDCNSCNLKVVCDEVEGLKKMHFEKFSVQHTLITGA